MPEYCNRIHRPPDGSAVRIGLRLGFTALMLLLGIAADGATAGLTVENPPIRFIIKSRPAAGYFALQNNTDSAVDLTSASSNACGMLMLHQSKEVNGVEKMLPGASIRAIDAMELVSAVGRVCISAAETLRRFRATAISECCTWSDLGAAGGLTKS